MSRTGFGWSWPRASLPTSGVSMTTHSQRREDHRTARRARHPLRDVVGIRAVLAARLLGRTGPASSSPRRRRGRLRDADPSFGSRVARPAAGRRTHHEQRRPGPRHRPHQSRQQRPPHYHRRPGATLQDLVGGYIEVVYGYCGPDGADHDDPRITFCVNEEGKIHNLPVNRLATELWWHYDRCACAYCNRGCTHLVTVSRARVVGLTAGGSVRYMCTASRGRPQCRTHGSDD